MSLDWLWVFEHLFKIVFAGLCSSICKCVLSPSLEWKALLLKLMESVWHSCIYGECNYQAKKPENPTHLLFFFFLRQTVDEELLLLAFKNKRKIMTELLQETWGGKPISCSFPLYCLWLMKSKKDLVFQTAEWKSVIGTQHCIKSCVHLSWEWVFSYHTASRFFGLFAQCKVFFSQMRF